MSVTRDDAGNITSFHAQASGLRLIPPINSRDASGATGTKWRHNPTLIHTPGPARGTNPYGKGRFETSDRRAATSSSSQHAPKRPKVDHPGRGAPSKYFLPEPRTRSQRAQAVLPPSPSRNSHAADTIIVDEDDTSDINDSSSKPVIVKSSSPDPMDIITSESPYTFDQSKPSPMDLFSSILEEMPGSPKDGESTARLRNQKQTEAQYTPSRLNGNAQPAKAPGVSRTVASALTGGFSEPGHVKRIASRIEQRERHIDLRKQGKKNSMKPKQRNVTPLSIQLRDTHATRPSGFISGSGPSKGKAIRRNVVCKLPLKDWSIGVDVSPQGATAEPRANLIWESEPGVLKVEHVNRSTLFELDFNKGSLKSVRYVDVKDVDVNKAPLAKLLVQIHPLSDTVTLQSSATSGFKLGSPDADGLLTFIFDPNSSDWDEKLYSEFVHALISNDKSILGPPGAHAVWEAVTRAQGDRSTRSEPGPELLENPRKIPDSVTKPRPRLKPRSEVVPIVETFVRRSARLSGLEQQRFSPRPDPDEVILHYRSGTGSLNITNGDVNRLQPSEFLNDTLIEFGLKLWLADLHESNPDLASQVHVFSSFFYKKLSTKIPEEGYQSVRKWTSKFDLFQKKYIIVPINENMHWYLAIIYFPEYTLLPRPVQATNVIPRRSTRQFVAAIDCSGEKGSEPKTKESLPPDRDPPPSAQTSAFCSGLITPGSSRTDDQNEEIDVERMVESAGPLSEPLVKQTDGLRPETVDKGVPGDDAAGQEDSLTLIYPRSSPPVQHAELPSLDHQGDMIEHEGHPASRSLIESTAGKSGISPITFYGKSNHKRRNIASPEITAVDSGASVEIVIEEDVVMGDPDGEREETAEHLKTYIFTFDSLSSKHPQAVKRLSKYLLMEAHDKRQLAEDTLTEPKGMQAIVPDQPNFCDCGIYLLHFAKTFMKDPKLSSEIIVNRPSPQKGRRVVHEHWDGASVGSYRNELIVRINSMSEEWKRERSEQDAATKFEVAAPQADTVPTPAASSRADNDSDSEIEVLNSPKKVPSSKASRRDSGGLADSHRKKGAAARARI